MSGLPNLNDKSLDLDLRMAAIDVLDGLKSARQMAFNSRLKYPVFTRFYAKAERAYREFCEEIGAEYQPPIDHEKEFERRLQELKERGF